MHIIAFSNAFISHFFHIAIHQFLISTNDNALILMYSEYIIDMSDLGFTEQNACLKMIALALQSESIRTTFEFLSSWGKVF